MASDAGVDAGTDAAVDAGTDASLGAGVDAGTDAGLDAGADAGACSSTNTLIARNHLHALTIPAADVIVGVDQTYDMMGTAMHTHSLTVTAAHFATLRAGGSVTITSSGPMPTHVTVTCV